MKQIYILRHAKSSWDNKNLTDFERPLSERGKNDAKKLCSYVHKNHFKIEKVICSKAKRTKQTFDLIADGLNFKIEDAYYTDKLYFGDTEYILKAITEIDEKFKNILIIGHNPTLHLLIERLTGVPIDKFTTCNLAIVNFNGSWKKISSDKCKLELVVKPKEI